jgi:hypothetical protein
MWMYPAPSCPDHSFSAELDDAEINARIWGILVHGANQNPGSSMIPLRGRGHQPLGESAQAHFCPTVSISASLTRMCSYAGSWVCT